MGRARERSDRRGEREEATKGDEEGGKKYRQPRRREKRWRKERVRVCSAKEPDEPH